MTQFLQLCFQGLALGSKYALVALGFVVIYRSTRVINFAQGSMAALGAYIAYNFHVTWGLPFYVAALLAVLAGALVGAAIERMVIRRMVGKPPFAVLMITVGLVFVIDQVVTTIWGFANLNLGDPWGIRTVKAGGLVFAVGDLWTIGIVGVVMTGFFAYFRFSRMGLAMRATALDQEVALAQGISAGRVFAVSWAIAGGVATLAGIALTAGAGNLRPGVSLIALIAFPAMILGGLDSPGGAVIGGVVIGITQTLTQGYQPEHAAWLGNNFHTVMPYVVMVIILLIRPYGLFGTREVRRV